MSLTVVTGWSPEGWKHYGQRFITSFERHWPPDVALVVYGEEACSELLYDFAVTRRGIQSGRALTFRPLQFIEGCVEFLQRHRDNLAAQGRKRLPQHRWKERAIQGGYNFRFDAWKFCRQGFIPLDAATRATSDFLCWLDGDVVTHSPVPSASIITRLMPHGKVIAYLGREPKHPDIAFQLYDIRVRPDANGNVTFPHAAMWQMLQNFAALYRTDAVFQEGEWHSAHIWKRAVDIAGAWPVVHNLTPGGHGHVWQQSPLRIWGDHLKGDRKFR